MDDYRISHDDKDQCWTVYCWNAAVASFNTRQEASDYVGECRQNDAAVEADRKARAAAENQRTVDERRPMASGWRSNEIITRRNGGVRHQFADSIGGCSSNYR